MENNMTQKSVKYLARICPTHLRDTDGCDPKVLLKGVLIIHADGTTTEFRDHCYVSIERNKHLKAFLKTNKLSATIGFSAKVYTYDKTKQSLCQIKNIVLLDKK